MAMTIQTVREFICEYNIKYDRTRKVYGFKYKTETFTYQIKFFD